MNLWGLCLPEGESRVYQTFPCELEFWGSLGSVWLGWSISFFGWKEKVWAPFLLLENLNPGPFLPKHGVLGSTWKKGNYFESSISIRDHPFKTIFDPYPPSVGSFLLLSVGKFGQFFTPPPLRCADVLNGWSLSTSNRLSIAQIQVVPDLHHLIWSQFWVSWYRLP